MLNLRAVETLREVAARGSFSAAATALHLTQPAVSRQVALLEHAVGMPLAIRSRQGVRLTPAGRLVVEHADAIHARLQRLEDELGEMSEGTRLHVTLGGFPTAFVGLVPAIVRKLREQGPGTTIALRRCAHDEAVDLVRAAELDLALVFARLDVRPEHGDIEVVPLVDEPMLALLPRSHLLAEQEEVELAELSDEPWIVGASDPASSVIAAACRRAGFEPRVAFETDDALATESLVGTGLGVSLSSPWLAAALRDDVVLRPLAPPVPTRRVQAVVADPAGPGARVLLKLAREATAGEPQT